MSDFDALDAMVLDTAAMLFGDTATIFPMKASAAGVNGKPVPDDSREAMTGVSVIRSEWSERGQIGGQGMPTPQGAFKLASAGYRVIATLQPASLAWVPKKGDELVYDDRPEARYQIAEPMPDGGAGLHLGLTRISA